MSILKSIAQQQFAKLFNKGWGNEEAFIKFLNGWKFVDPVPITKNKCKLSIIEVGEWKIYCFAPNTNTENSDKALYWLNGSAYVMEVGAFHWKYFIRLVKKLGVKLYCPILPVYKRDGKNIDRNKLYEAFVSCYKKILEFHPANKISVGGDSSGGGLSLLLPTLLQKTNLPLPRRILLVNPLADCDLKNFKPQNPSGKWIFPKVGLEKAIKIFAGDTSLKDPYVSPYYTDFSILPDTYLFYGTYDEVLIDMQNLEAKLAKFNKLTKSYVYPKCFHDFFILPIPEAYKYIRDLKIIIEQD